MDNLESDDDFKAYYQSLGGLLDPGAHGGLISRIFNYSSFEHAAIRLFANDAKIPIELAIAHWEQSRHQEKKDNNDNGSD